MKKLITIFLCLLMLSGCHSGINKSDNYFTFTDSYGTRETICENAKIISCYGSLGECWLLSGGKLAGATDDIYERDIQDKNDFEIVGTVKEINIEKLISLNPDYVILSSDIEIHKDVSNTLTRLGIKNGRFNIDNFENYKELMYQFCSYNKRNDLYKINVSDVEKRISDIKSRIPDNKKGSYLLMRAYSNGIKVKSNNIADDIINTFSESITKNYPSMLEDVSMEEIITQNPDYIFVLTMGNEDNALNFLKNNIENNKAWKNLKAVQNSNYIVLPKELFHYKPNNRWDKSYEYIAKIIYPELYR